MHLDQRDLSTLESSPPPTGFEAIHSNPALLDRWVGRVNHRRSNSLANDRDVTALGGVNFPNSFGESTGLASANRTTRPGSK